MNPRDDKDEDDFDSQEDNVDKEGEDSTFQFNFVEKGGDRQALYKSTQKSATGYAQGGGFSHDMTDPADPRGGRSHQKPARHLSALHSSAQNS